MPYTERSKFPENLILTIAVFLTLFYVNAIASGNDIALVKSRYDNVESVLKNYKIPYDLLKYSDLEKKDFLLKYKYLYLPSGIENPFYSNIDLTSWGTRIKSVTLKKDIYIPDRKKITENIKEFIERGGSAYFSGYTYKIIQDAFHPFHFFDNFPFMGLPGRITVNLKNDLKRFAVEERSALYIKYPGWVAIKSLNSGEIIASGEFNTPRGIFKGPISIIFKWGKGEALYTSYYSTVFSNFRRFNIFRIAGKKLIDQIYSDIKKFEQNITGTIADSILSKEYFRIYYFDLQKGSNTIYFKSDKNYYQIDIFDQNMSLIKSADLFEREQRFDIESKKETICFVKIYPSTEKRCGMFAIVSARGARTFPYYNKIITALLILTSTVLFIVLIRLFKSKRYSGKGRYI